MKEKKIFGFLSKNPLIWFHYLPLVGVLFLAHWVGGELINLDYQAWYVMVIWYYAFIATGDMLIHALIGQD